MLIAIFQSASLVSSLFNSVKYYLCFTSYSKLVTILYMLIAYLYLTSFFLKKHAHFSSGTFYKILNLQLMNLW